MPEFLNMLELLIIMLCAVGCAVSACYYQRQRGTVSRLRDELNQLHKHLLGLERDLGALVSCSRHIGDRIGDGETQPTHPAKAARPSAVQRRQPTCRRTRHEAPEQRSAAKGNHRYLRPDRRRNRHPAESLPTSSGRLSQRLASDGLRSPGAPAKSQTVSGTMRPPCRGEQTHCRLRINPSGKVGCRARYVHFRRLF